MGFYSADRESECCRVTVYFLVPKKKQSNWATDPAETVIDKLISSGKSKKIASICGIIMVYL